VAIEEVKLPFYLRATIIILGFIALITVLYICQSIIVPLVFATIIAIVLHPLVLFFVHLKINRVVAIAIAMFFTFIVIASFGVLIISQVSRFIESWPVLIERFSLLINQTITDASEYFEKDPQKIHEWISTTLREIVNISTGAIGQTLVLVGNGLVILFLLPVYIFLILFYEPLLIEFILRLFSSNNHGRVTEIVVQIKSVLQHYLVGLIIEAAIMTVLNTTVLLILGIEYALIIGFFGALINIIPYIGGLVAVAVPVIVALVTKSSPMYAVYVLAAYYFIQLIDNNYIVPKIVASKVKINALFSIIVVFAGNALWGIPGMFLSIPVLAIIKLICDNIEPLKPWGFLLGDTMPPIIKIDSILKKMKGKSK
jgi:predicted PurR-regulated permease PerM